MSNKNIIFKKSIEQYKKKYRNRTEHLLIVTKKQVEEFDKIHKLEKDYLLKGRKWALIDDKYYEIPKAPRWTWFRNLKTSTQIISSVLVAGAVATPITLGVYYALQKEDVDVKFTKDLNNYISQDKNVKSLFDAVDYVKKNKGINLEKTKTKIDNREYAFDIDSHKFVVLNSDGSVLYSPSKINSKSSVFRFADKYEITATPSNPSEVYGTYLREEAKENNTNITNVELKFYTSIDVGYNKKYNLKFAKTDTSSDFKPIVVSNRNDLEINGNISDIHHYGIATSLTVEKLEGNYIEHGSVDGEVRLKSPVKLTVEEDSQINSIVVEVQGVTITAKKDSYVGTVSKSDASINLDDVVKAETGADVQKNPTVVPTSKIFDGGLGIERSPYSISTSTSLVDLSNKVNDDNTTADYAGKHYRITKDIDMTDVAFIPIGNSTNKFKGHFDGCNFTISNLNIKQTTANCGLFGVIEGTENESFKNKTHVWKNNAFYEDNITEDKYLCVIKNLNIANSNFEIEASAQKKHVGALAGIAFAARIENVHFISGTVKGWKAVGGLAGDLSCCAMLNCSTGSDVTVTTDVYHVGGISGYTQSRIGDCSSGQVIVNTTNNAKIVCLNNENPGAGGAGGLCGYTNGGDVDKSLSIIGCVNNGIVTTNPDGGAKRPQYIAGIVGYGHQGLELIANTTNNGQVINNATETVDDMAGICSLGRAEFVNCANNGDLIGKAKFKAGIVAGEANSSHFTQEVKNCVNNGKIVADGGRASTIASDTQDLKLSDVEFATTSELFNGLTSSIYTGHIYEFNNVKVNNPGAYNIASDVSRMTIKSDTKLFETFTIPHDIVSVDIEAPMGNVTLDNAPSAYITINSKNTVVTIPEGATISHLIIKGEGSSIVNNGTITTGVELNGLSSKCTNNGTIGGFSVNNVEGTVAKEFINNGTVTREQNHCIAVSSDTATCNLTIHNYGNITCTSTIEGHYLVLYYCKGHMDMYNYDGSSINCLNNISNVAYNQNATGVFYHKPNATFSSATKGTGWDKLAGKTGNFIEQEF